MGDVDGTWVVGDAEGSRVGAVVGSLVGFSVGLIGQVPQRIVHSSPIDK